MLAQGRAKWTKLFSKPHPGYDGAYNEWSVDVYFDDKTVEKLKTEGLGKRLKDKGNGIYMSFKRKELKQDGSPNQPVRVVDHRGEAWNPSIKIGNGSIVNVNFAINEYGKGEKSANILSLQVWDLVKYEGGEFPVREDAKNEDWASEVSE